MPIVAFDAKSFRRGKYVPTEDKKIAKFEGFITQLGISVVFKNADAFVDAYVGKSAELRKSFSIDDNLPFYSSTYLKQVVGLYKAIPFADQLITHVQDHIDRIHCTFVVLSPDTIRDVKVGGFKCPSKQVPTQRFLDSLGPMFSYLAAYSFTFQNRFKDTRDLEYHLDAFRSNQTVAWETVAKMNPKVFYRGDECNPFISCADIIAFLTDAKLYSQFLKLERPNLEKVWQDYSFDLTSHFLDQTALNLYTWKSDMQIDFRKHLAKPTIFLMIDEFEKSSYGVQEEDGDAEDIGVETEDNTRQRVRKFGEVIKKTDVYYAAARYAYSKKGCIKIFQKHEDMDRIADGDTLVYVGGISQKIAEAYKDSFEIEVISGRELRKKMKQL